MTPSYVGASLSLSYEVLLPTLPKSEDPWGSEDTPLSLRPLLEQSLVPVPSSWGSFYAVSLGSLHTYYLEPQMRLLQ